MSDGEVEVVRLGILGAVTAHRDGEQIALPGRRHRAVLARLVIARGRVVPVDRLIDDMWADHPPAGALAAIQTFVSRLRRAIEPDRPARSAAQIIVTTPPGYALRLSADAVDAWQFERMVSDAGSASSPAAALQVLDAALRLWNGPAFGEFRHEPWACGEADRFDEVRRIAIERRADAAIRVGRATEAVTALEQHVTANPLREEAWRLLALALYESERQADALAALRKARVMLRDELGVEPGRALRRLELDILDHTVDPAADAASPAILSVPAQPAPAFVGRHDDLARLVSFADPSTFGLVVLTGEAGSGKTTLLGELGRRLRSNGWLVGSGRCAEIDAVPPGWACAQLVRDLTGCVAPEPSLRTDLGWLLDDNAYPVAVDPTRARFVNHTALQRYLRDVSATAPVLLLLDDMHRADHETLALLLAACAALESRPALIILARRATESTSAFEEALDALARLQPMRMALSGLDSTAVRELVASIAHIALDEATAHRITERSGGNPFFVKEIARQIDSEGVAVALSHVPAGVRDVLARRFARLPDTARSVLTQASVLGRRVDLDILVDVVGGEDEVVVALEAAVVLGLLVESDDGGIEFPHDLVRDAVYESTSRMRRARTHARVGDALEKLRPAESTALFHHFAAAGRPHLAGKVVRYGRLAAEEAIRRHAYHEATGLWQRTLEAFDQAHRGDEQVRERLELLLGQVQARALAGDVVGARTLRDECLRESRAVDDPQLIARVLASFDVHIAWTNRPYGTVDMSIVTLATRTLERLAPDDVEARCRLMINLAIELDISDPLGQSCAAHAEADARSRNDPGLLAMALNAGYFQTFWIGNLDEHARVSNELAALGAEHAIPSAEVVGRLGLMQAHAARGEFDLADRHLDEVEQLVDQYELSLLRVIVMSCRAGQLGVAGRIGEAIAAYVEAARELGRVGQWDQEPDIVPFATALLHIGNGRLDRLRELRDTTALSQNGELRALISAVTGDVDRAADTLRSAGTIRRDYIYEIRWVLRGLYGITVDDADEVAAAYHALLPYADLIAAGLAGSYALGPVATTLGDLAVHQGEIDIATTHYETAVAMAQRANAPDWTRVAQQRLLDIHRHGRPPPAPTSEPTRSPRSS